MKAVILAGGFGSRLSEETQVRPKPMVEIGGKPILWHIMKIYASHGISDFIICCGYKGFIIKEYFANYFLNNSDCRFDLKQDRLEILRNGVEEWSVAVIDTGEQTMTGGRLRRVKEYIGTETFCFTYGDGVTDLSITDLIEFHRRQQTLATLTAVQPPGRFGAFSLEADETKVVNFKEKPKGSAGWINGGFFVLEPEIFDYIDSDDAVWEQQPMERLAKEGQISAYRHRGFWQNMDTLRDRMVLEQLWALDKPPWKLW